MVEIPGGILLAIAVVALILMALRFVVLALSAIVCVAIFIGLWLLLASGVGEWWASVILAGGLAIWFWSANHGPIGEKLPVSRAPDIHSEKDRTIL